MCAARVLRVAALLCAVCAARVPERRAPRLLEEPPARLYYVASRGTHATCAARGDPPPALAWTGDVAHPHVHVYPNGSLVVGAAPRAGPPLSVRCRATNTHGVALSRPVTLLPVADEAAWHVAVQAQGAAPGGLAVLTCRVAPPAPLVRVTGWYRGERALRLDTYSSESRLVRAGDTLLIRELRAEDAGPYSCVTSHALLHTARRSSAALLALSPRGSPGPSPRVWRPSVVLAVSPGRALCLPCGLSAHTPTHYTWSREEGQGEEQMGGTWRWGEGAALCVRAVALSSHGAWSCSARSPRGLLTARVLLSVAGALAVRVTPALLEAQAGGTARLSCACSVRGAALSWLHDGAAAGAGPELVVAVRGRAQRGVYQCVASTPDGDSAQAAAELRLTAWAPELVDTFIEQALRPGGLAALRCAASAEPPARFAWLRDGVPLEPRDRYRVSEGPTPDPSGPVQSVLSVNNMRPEDGGLYTCRAHNALGHVEHSARLNVYGAAGVRVAAPVRAVAGSNSSMLCAYYGYPISSVAWWRGASAVGPAGRVSARGEALRLAPALARDAGPWTCEVTQPHGAPARADVLLQVSNPPKISPFMFSSDLTEGSSAQVLCGVSSGDKPMYFSWLKDGAPLPSNLQIEEKSLGEFSLLMLSELSARHSGAYTCRVSNRAAAVDYTAPLLVNVAPTWRQEPRDAAVRVGAPLELRCEAAGQPAPLAAWQRLGPHGPAGPTPRWEAAGEGGTLRARAAGRALAGTYRCVADNGVGAALQKVVNITVYEAAHFEEEGATNVSSVAGRDAELACEARGDAPLVVTWTRRGERLDPASYRWSVAEERRAEGVRSTLRVRGVRGDDAGEYRCVARNGHGHDERALLLTVHEPPGVPSHVSLGGRGSRWVRVLWGPALRATSYSALCTELRGPAPHAALAVNLTLDSTRDYHRAVQQDAEGGELSALLGGLRPAAAYSLRLLAHNRAGSSPHSSPLLVTTLEEAPGAPPQDVLVAAGAAGELHVSWSAPPQESWNGELVGHVTSWRELDRLEDDEEEAAEVRPHAGAVWVARADSAVRVCGLRAGRHAVWVRAATAAGAGPPSPAVHAAPGPAPPAYAPRRPVCHALGPRTVRVRWTLPPAHLALDLTGYDLDYAAMDLDISQDWGEPSESARVGAAGAAAEATLQALLPATNYSVWVRARSAAGPGPPSAPVYCTTTDDVPGAVRRVAAVGGGGSLRVTWLPPRGAPPTHYTLYGQHTDRVGGEWSERVEARGAGEEVRRDVPTGGGPLRLWVRAGGGAGEGPPSPTVLAAPDLEPAARVTSLSRVVQVAAGGAARLPCGAVGAPPLKRQWRPAPPPAHSLSADGDLLIHSAPAAGCLNYTCSVHNSAGGDSLELRLCALAPPPAPALRLVRAGWGALSLAWGAGPGTGAALGYTLVWAREQKAPRTLRLPPGATTHTLAQLACGALYSMSMRAHGRAGASPLSAPLRARTLGHKARAPPGNECLWVNNTSVRVSLVSWGAAPSCPVTSWSVALRAAGAGAWTRLRVDGESAQASGLSAGTWHELRVEARGAAGATLAQYRVATLTSAGERLGEVLDVRVEAPPAAPPPAPWRAPLAPALLAALALLLAALTGSLVAVRRVACLRREETPAQMYSVEPCKTNGKILAPPDVTDELHEISPYATFTMAGVCGGGGGAGAERDALAVPPRPRLLAHSNEYGPGPDTDSESSGSPCAACALHLYRAPAPHLAGACAFTPSALDSSADDTWFRAGGGTRSGGRSWARRRGRRCTKHAPHSPHRTARAGGAAGAAGAARR